MVHAVELVRRSFYRSLRLVLSIPFFHGLYHLVARVLGWPCL
jgi:hypothetical protein